MLIIIGTAGSREKNTASVTTPAVNNNPTTINTIFSARSRRIVPPRLLSPHDNLNAHCCFAYSALAYFSMGMSESASSNESPNLNFVLLRHRRDNAIQAQVFYKLAAVVGDVPDSNNRYAGFVVRYTAVKSCSHTDRRCSSSSTVFCSTEARSM